MQKYGFVIKLLLWSATVLLIFFAYPLKVAPQENPAPTPSLAKIVFNFITDQTALLKGEGRGRINILLLGMTGVPHPAPYLTDTIILLSVKPNEHALGLLSLPRDLLVQVPGKKIYAKINSLYNMNGRDPAFIREKAEEITGQPIDYYLALDVSAAETIVDELGGLNVLVPEDVSDPRFPSDNEGTETFSVGKGWRWFDGHTVQRYLRTRHSEGGDFARMRQQQAVLEALRKKVFGLHLLYNFPTVLSVYRTLATHIRTDMDEAAITRFYDIAKEIHYDKVIQKVVDGDPNDQNSLLKSKTFALGGDPAFVLVPKTGDFDYYSIKEMAENIFTK